MRHAREAVHAEKVSSKNFDFVRLFYCPQRLMWEHWLYSIAKPFGILNRNEMCVKSINCHGCQFRICCAILSRASWNPGSSSVHASTKVSKFYHNKENTVVQYVSTSSKPFTSNTRHQLKII